MSGINSRNASGIRTLDNTNIQNSFISGELKGDEYSSIDVATVKNKHGILKINSLSSEAPIETTLTQGNAHVSLAYDDSRLVLDSEGNLSTIEADVRLPLQYSSDDHQVSLQYDNDSLFINDENQLAAKKQDPPELNSPLFYNDDDEIELRYASHMEDAESILDGDLNLFAKGLSLKISDPFYYNVLNSHKLSLKIDDDTMDIDGGKLKALIPDKLVFEYPLDEIDGQVSLRIDEDTLEVDYNKLKAKTQDVSKSLKGAGAISVYRDITESIYTCVHYAKHLHQRWS
ncbi:hypothetical protein DFS34DRAFT_597667 [Phlyctochytrium arcticum]|nr:hypothetical protein DFS34DRAFT_654126 [Phlyctochytrium arcticum]KAI9090295.1 hypothetical protein DFS34DRAFT_654127 [Phlyctochytrium arcticum]KAI9090296.1 hypothetical protein DFS34DRAFT_597667 [Phlyctochytrium arcticum]